MPTEDNFIVAIEIGSSNVTAVAGRKQPDGIINVRAFVQEKSKDFIRKGRINNFTKMTTCIEGIKRKLEDKLHKSISGAYVGIGGMGMHTVANTVTRHLSDKVLITRDIIDNIVDANRSQPADDHEILQVIPQNYKLGAQIVEDPDGIAADSIEGRFLNIIAGTSLRADVQQCFTSAKLHVFGMPISVLALADAILSESEKRSGCVFVDMGAETTAVAIYKNNKLRHLAILPLGGANINRDICTTFQIEEAEAENLKRQYGSACIAPDVAEHAPLQLNDGRSIKFEDFATLVQGRMEEIIQNINNQIELSGYKIAQLIAGITITGGAAAIKNLDTAIKELTNFERWRIAKNLQLLQYKTDPKLSSSFNIDGTCNAAIAIIDKGNENCCGGAVGSENANLFEDPAKAASTPDGKPTDPTTPQGIPSGTAEDIKPEEPAQTVEEEQPKKTGPSKWSKFRKAITGFANKIVNDDEETFPGSSNENK